MARPNWNLVRTLLARTLREPAAVADADLLDRYRATRDAAAFELLVRRYADLVFGVCRRVCRDSHDAEDAFQATFLILAKKAHSVRSNLAGWLHRTAKRAALRASQRRNRLHVRETSMIAEPAFDTDNEVNDLKPVLDAEIDKLPERLRLAVLACYVEGHTTEDAAALFGVPRGTILSRLSKARDLLAARLTRRGITAATLTAALAPETASASLVAQTAATFLLPAAGSAVELLSLEVLRMSAWKTTTVWAAALVLTAGLGTGTAVILAQGEKPVTSKQQTRISEFPQEQEPTAPKPAQDQSDRILNQKKQFESMQKLHNVYAAKQVELQNTIRRILAEKTHTPLEDLDNEIAALRDTITKLRKDLFNLEDQRMQQESALLRASRELRNTEKSKPNEAEIEAIIQSSRKYIQTRAVYEQRMTAYIDAESKSGDATAIASTKKARDEALAELEKITSMLQSEAAEKVRRQGIELHQKSVNEEQSELESIIQMINLKEKRLDEVKKQCNLLTTSRRQIADLELELHGFVQRREILERKIMLLEFELQGVTVEKQSPTIEDLAREVAELKAEIKKLSGKK